jgi:hypothetical protein
VSDGEEQTRDVIVLTERVVTNWWRAYGHRLVLADLDDVLAELPARLVLGTGAYGQTVAIFGNKLAPSLGHRYLARTGYDSQQTDEPAERNRPDNLFEPLPGDRGAHGRFDRQAHPRSVQFWATRHRRVLALFGLATLGAVTKRTIGARRGALRH